MKTAKRKRLQLQSLAALATSKPRNLGALAMFARKSGVHEKSWKAKRRHEAVQLRKEIPDRDCSSRVEHAAFNRQARVRCPSVPPTI